MSSAIVIGALTWLHVLGAMGWFGGDLVFMIGLDPKLGRLSPPARSELITKVFPGLNMLEMAFAGATVVFGPLLLLAMTGGDFGMLSPSTSWGLAMSAGAGLALVAFVLEIGFHTPAVRRMIAAAREVERQGPGSSEAEVSRHEERAETGERVIIVLLFLAFSCMIAAGQL